MSTVVFHPSSVDDVGYWTSAGGFESGGWTDVSSGIGNSSGTSFHSWILFRNVSIPKNKIVESAIVSIVASYSKSTTPCNVLIYANDSSSPSVPSSVSAADALALTSSVAWSGVAEFVAGSTYQTPSLVSIVQGLLNRSDWSSGCNILVLIKDNGSSTNCLRDFYTYGYSSGSKKPSLTLSYTQDTAYVLFSPLTSTGLSGASGSMSLAPMASNQTGALCSIPILTFSASGSQIITTYAQGSMSFAINNDGLGGMSVEVFTAGLASQSIPALTSAGTAKPGNDGVMSFAPGSATGRIGANGGFVLSVPTSTGRTINFARGACTFQALALYGFVYTGTLARGDCSFKKLSCSSLGLNGRVCRGEMGVKIRMTGTALAGKLMSGATRMQPATATGQASISSKGTSALAFFPLDMAGVATADAREFSSTLAYDKEAVQ